MGDPGSEIGVRAIIRLRLEKANWVESMSMRGAAQRSTLWSTTYGHAPVEPRSALLTKRLMHKDTVIFHQLGNQPGKSTAFFK